MSYTVSGDPNKLALKASGFTSVPAAQWEKVPRNGLDQQNMRGVLIAENGTFVIGSNNVVPKNRCEFLQQFQKDVVNKLGFAVGTPGYDAMKPAAGDQPPPATPYNPAARYVGLDS